MEILNRKARHDYFIEEEYECGLVLTNNDSSKQLAIVFEKLSKTMTEKEKAGYLEKMLLKMAALGYTTINEDDMDA